jgi:Protein ChrB, N-terminal
VTRVTREWELLIYRLPAQPSRVRVAVWRELRRLGALPLQQGVVALPATEALRERLDEIERRIRDEGGSSYRFALPAVDDEQGARLRADWNALREQEYAEIVEECETKFAKEIEFEIFRGNLTAGEAEEIEADLEKIRAWFARIEARDLFGARKRTAAERAIRRASELLDDFVERVYRAEEIAGGPVLEPPVDLPWGSTDERDRQSSDAVVPLKRGRRRRQGV